MNQTERRIFLIGKLLEENSEYRDMEIPRDEESQRRLLRALMNVRMPGPIDEEFLKVQDEYLKEVALEKGIVSVDDIAFNEDGIGLWQGDITRLKVDAIVNAANVACPKLIPSHVLPVFGKARNSGTLRGFSALTMAA